MGPSAAAGDRVALAQFVGHRGAPAVRVELEGRFVRIPRLTCERDRDLGAEQVGLREAAAQSALERGILALHCRRAGAAEEVHVLPLRLAAEAFLRTVAGAQPDLPVLGLCHRDLHRHEAVGHFLGPGRHGGELEESQFVQAPLAQLDRRQAEAVPRLEGERAGDDVVTHAHVAGHRHRAVQCIGPRRCPQRQRDLFGRHWRFFGRHQRQRMPAILQGARRHRLCGNDLRAVHHRARLQRQLTAKREEIIGRDRVEALEHQALHDARRALVHRDRESDGVLRVVQVCVEGGDLRVGIAAVLVIGLDPAEIGVEHRAIEIALAAPRQPAAGLRAQHGLHPAGPQLVGALDLEAGHLDSRLGRARHAPRIGPRRQRAGRLPWRRGLRGGRGGRLGRGRSRSSGPRPRSGRPARRGGREEGERAWGTGRRA